MNLLTHLIIVVGILCTGVVYGTDVFCAIAQRPALARVDDVALTAVMGNLHRFADRRMPIPGVLAIVAAAAAATVAGVTSHAPESTAAATALVLSVAWLALYLRISAPINRTLTAAADAHRTPADARALQQAWDRIIVLRAVLQGLALAALCIGLTG